MGRCESSREEELDAGRNLAEALRRGAEPIDGNSLGCTGFVKGTYGASVLLIAILMSTAKPTEMPAACLYGRGGHSILKESEMLGEVALTPAPSYESRALCRDCG
jgi:hypothetical protein